ncbi:OmpA/MotB domain protein [Candidatus Sulfopaludibacter sp. SbA4]|nr:OmpA/MotB domain protein [Candidatus Sulfopaludibacter sp. SbA4]
MTRGKPPEAAAPPPVQPVRRSFQRSHRGGAWKVAYADFVTAMMALFIVLWMMNSTEKVKQSISGYFRDPRGYTTRLGAGPAGAGEGLSFHGQTAGDLQKQIEQALRRMPDFKKIGGNVQFSVTGEGLRIEMLETEQGMFFISGSANPTDTGGHLLGVLGAELGKMPNQIVIEGHSDARPFRNAGGYSNWELSVDRSNAARRLLQESGVRIAQIVEVRGFADQRLFRPEDPNDPRNRRVSVVVKFQ